MTIPTAPSLPMQARRRRSGGFTLIELMIVVVIVGILAAIAYPSYVNSVVRTKRAAAAACLSNLATHMERFYTTNLRYNNADNSAPALPQLDCMTQQATGRDYSYGFSGTPTATAYTLQATAIGVQATRDSGCGNLTLTQAGTRGVSGSRGAAACW